MKHIINLTFLLLLPTIFNATLFPQISLQEPILISPAHNEKFKTVPKEFRWFPVKESKYYWLQVTTDVTFMNLSPDNDINQTSLIDTFFRETSTLLLDTMYFWRVAAQTNNTDTSWSFIRSFVTGNKKSIYEKWNKYSDISICPIPIKEKANIIVSFENAATHVLNSKLVLFYIFDINGQLINQIGKCEYENNVELNFDASIYNSGVYSLLVVNEKSEIIGMKNIVIEK